MRKAGVLMPVASLPSVYGSGDFGPSARELIDQISAAGFGIWQILPLNPLGYGNSPYQPYSSYAMDEMYLSLDLLQQQGLISHLRPYHANRRRIDYEGCRRFRRRWLRQAYHNFKPDLNYMVFSFQEWVKNYALFMAFHSHNQDQCWTQWPEPMRDQPRRQMVDLAPYRDEILFHVFVQYELFLQWKDLKEYARQKGISIMGDLPFYVGLDSADVWSHRECFLLDKDGHPRFVAGVPPDYFSADGQRWGNPIYNWPYLKKTGFTFWLDRLAYTQQLFDTIRVDHFRAFDTYWKIPADCPTARVGRWVSAPGYDLFDALFAREPDIHIVAEDLGDLRAQVLELRDHYSFRGMRVIQFSFDPAHMPEDQSHLLVYTGTHDNDTIRAWYQQQPKEKKRQIRRYFQQHGDPAKDFTDNMIQYALNCKADMVILPMADLLGLGKEGRINTPGTVGNPNWQWRLRDWQGLQQRQPALQAMLSASRRNSRQKKK